MNNKKVLVVSAALAIISAIVWSVNASTLGDTWNTVTVFNLAIANLIFAIAITVLVSTALHIKKYNGINIGMFALLSTPMAYLLTFSVACTVMVFAIGLFAATVGIINMMIEDRMYRYGCSKTSSKTPCSKTSYWNPYLKKWINQ